MLMSLTSIFKINLSKESLGIPEVQNGFSNKFGKEKTDFIF